VEWAVDDPRAVTRRATWRGNVGSIGGSGLGLAITQRAVELHQGTLRVASTPGVGTTFEVDLPAGAGPQPEPGRPASG
jgi:signal transduction histidine kinase